MMEQIQELKIKAPRIATTIKMEPEVAVYLQRLADHLQRDRTFLINAIVSEHAQRHRGKIPPPLRIIPMGKTPNCGKHCSVHRRGQ